MTTFSFYYKKWLGLSFEAIWRNYLALDFRRFLPTIIPDFGWDYPFTHLLLAFSSFWKKATLLELYRKFLADRPRATIGILVLGMLLAVFRLWNYLVKWWGIKLAINFNFERKSREFDWLTIYRWPFLPRTPEIPKARSSRKVLEYFLVSHIGPLKPLSLMSALLTQKSQEKIFPWWSVNDVYTSRV